MPDAVVSIWTPQFTTMYARNISASITRGSYTFDAGGCGAASLDTNLTWEQIYTSGFFEGRNGVEISMQDDVVAASVAHGATKIYVTATAPYDPAIILEKMVIALWDGALLTVGIPVTGVGTDGGGPYITVGPPLSRAIAPGNPSDTLLPAYGAGTVIYRRRWAGRIARRTRYHDNTARKTTLALIGIGTRLKECQTNFTCNSVDAGAALAALVYNCRDRFVDLDIADLVMPTVGSTYSGQSTNAFVSDVITQILAAMTGGIWGVRVHSDRIPRLIKLYDQATNTYPHIINLSNHATHFVPAALQSDDEDIGSMWNAVIVSGNVGGSSSLTVTAANADLTSVATYGQIDGAPQTLTSIKDQATAALIATGLLNEHSYPQSSTSFELHVRNDWDLGLAALASPSGLANADVGSGFEAIYLAGFDETQSVKNRAIDSPLAFTSGPLALWSKTGTTALVPGGSPNGENAWKILVQTGGSALGPSIPVAPGERVKFGTIIDTTLIGPPGTPPVDPKPRWSIVAGATVIASVYADSSVAADGVQYLLSADIMIPANVYAVQFLCTIEVPDPTRTATAAVVCAQPYLIAGNQLALFRVPPAPATGFLPAYAPNHAAPNIYGLPTSVTCAFEAAGDRTQSFSFAPVEPDINAIIAERAHAVANALLANTLPPVGVEAFVVSPEAGDYTYGRLALTVAFPACEAIFAKGTKVQIIAPATVTLAASGTTHVWLQTSGVYATRFNDPSNVPGAILIAYFSTDATGVLGDFRRCSYGPLVPGAGNVNTSGALAAPTTSGATSANGFSLNGLAADVDVTVPLTNVPTDTSATMVEFYWRSSVASGSANAWIAADGENLAYATGGKSIVGPNQTISFSYGALTKGATYDFGIAYRGPTGYGPITEFRHAHVAALIGIGAAYLLGGSTQPTLLGTPTITAVPSVSGVTSTLRLGFTCNNQRPTAASRPCRCTAMSPARTRGHRCSPCPPSGRERVRTASTFRISRTASRIRSRSRTRICRAGRAPSRCSGRRRRNTSRSAHRICSAAQRSRRRLPPRQPSHPSRASTASRARSASVSR